MNNTQLIRETSQESSLLRNALRGNALFSGLSGIVSLVAAQSLATFTGIQESLVFVILGVVLILFAVDLIWIASRESINRRFAVAVIFMDVAWVAGSAIILLFDLLPLTVAGRWTIALLAEVVAVFAILQTIGLRRSG
jgi:hypothetical protein